MALVDAITLNQKMVDHLQKGQDEQSIQLYTAEWATTFESRWSTELASRLLAPAVISPLPSRSSSPLPPSDQDEDSIIYTVHGSTSFLTTGTPVDVKHVFASSRLFTVRSVPTNALVHAKGSSFDVYNRVFEFYLDKDVVDTNEWFHCVVAIPIVAHFNVGRSHHAIAERSHSLPEFLSALAHYQAALLRIQDLVSCNQYVDEWDILLMALFNNLGHCLSRLNHTEHAMSCMEGLRIAYLWSSQKSRLYRQEVDFFVLQ